jgi:hypothetical protein
MPTGGRSGRVVGAQTVAKHTWILGFSVSGAYMSVETVDIVVDLATRKQGLQERRVLDTFSI